MGRGYNSAGVRGLYHLMGRGRLSLNFTFSNSTSHYLTISRGNGIISNSGVVFVLTHQLGGHKELGGSAIITAVVSGDKFFSSYDGTKVDYIRAGMNSQFICRRVRGGSCSLNNRRSNRVVVGGCTAANSKLLATVVILRRVYSAGSALSGLYRNITLCPRYAQGVHIGGGTRTIGSATILRSMGHVRRVVGNGNEMLVHRDKARPMVHVVIRTRGRRDDGRCTSVVTGAVVRENFSIRWICWGW